ncbi:flavodoxin [Enterococcus sp. BWR-S5]|uniref:flavodoxin n=1 Tax=Enterococcus sp. BWR-S5 TaxID=2787714 RepID=UPI00192153DF|nr:flavodoxin [Enterococcus sp. BWR-S5]MBL1224561.1 flavodoxin [Enterococcus sp. BWR-S5]
MKNSIIFGTTLLVTAMLGSCSADTDSNQQKTTVSRESTTVQNKQSQSNTLIIYYSEPESEGTDAVAGASRAEYDNRILGNTALMAEWIAEETNSDIHEIVTVNAYPGNHEKLVDQVKEELSSDFRPELITTVENLDNYETIFIGYPIWWSDIPTPLYTFLENTDLSGKRIIPFSTHGGSGFSTTISTIANLQPDAEVETENVLTISRNDISDSKDDVRDWLLDIGL